MPQRDPKKFDPARASTLDAAEREQYLPGGQLVALLELSGAETMLDYGAGTGRLALAALFQGRASLCRGSSFHARHDERGAGVQPASVEICFRRPFRFDLGSRILRK